MKKTQTIELIFDKSITRLAYYPYGKEVYDVQVKPKIDFTYDVINIIFPEQIVKAASSFVQGFFEEIVLLLGYEAIGEKIVIISPNDSLKISIAENLVL